MDWQQPTALLIVGLTAAVFARFYFRKRKFSFSSSGACGCGSSKTPQKSSITFRARKNGQREIIVHAK